MTKYRINRPSSDLWPIFTELQSAVRERFAEVYKQKLITYTAELVDGASVADRFWRLTNDKNVEQLDSMFPIHAARFMLDEAHQHVRKTRERLPELDIEFEATFMVDLSDDSIFVAPFYEGFTYREVVEGFSGMVEVSDSRFEAVMNSLGSRRAPETAGLSWTLIGFFPPSFHVFPVDDRLGFPFPKDSVEMAVKLAANILAVERGYGYFPKTPAEQNKPKAPAWGPVHTEFGAEPLTEKDLGDWK